MVDSTRRGIGYKIFTASFEYGLLVVQCYYIQRGAKCFEKSLWEMQSADLDHCCARQHITNGKHNIVPNHNVAKGNNNSRRWQ
mmetsp:Transcript_14715/g.31373  ORF Transcript_14715/g.31373 Transcript_14715/m.31373 type:complete len:83 (+) Transcript_14715:452-700(+)